jgi:sulfite reductase (NADPH) hemoprotein beta-component
MELLRSLFKDIAIYHDIERDFGVILETGQSAWLCSDTLFDLKNTFIHTILAANRNVNVLCLDTHDDHKRDLGLYSITYGNAYVASISPLANYSHAVQALKEAFDFPGPSIVLMHQPDLNYRDELEKVAFAKNAVSNGHFNLYRYHPESGIRVDSSKPRLEIEKFLANNQALSILANLDDLKVTDPTTDKIAQKAKLAFADLKNSINRKKLVILYGSDGGNAERVAKRIHTSATKKGLFSQLFAMDSYVTEDLLSLEYCLFVVSTAGQGEFPANARQTFKFLCSNALDLKMLNYAVFAMGDRHYWPDPKDAVYFCKSGKDLDKKLRDLNATRLTDIGIGDDRDHDGYNTGFDEFIPRFWEAMGLDSQNVEQNAPSDDMIKLASNYLRGTIAEGLQDKSTGALAEYDTKLTKFHGIYQQDDRDLRDQLSLLGREKAYSFMVRVRVPGGITSTSQWIAMHKLANEYANSTIKITTRQAFQFHGILKHNLKTSIQAINKSLMGILSNIDTIAACGDVNRNVMCNPNVEQSNVHERVLQFANELSTHLTPQTGAYHEIWLDKKLVCSFAEEEPLYGRTYLPRKFKSAVAIPPYNDVDVFAHCLGYIAIVEHNKLVGFNVTVGGGMGQTHGNKATYPVLAKILGFCTVEQAVRVGEAVMLVQRDHGDRNNRKHARLKYTIEDMGLDKFKEQVESRLGFELLESRPYKFISNVDRYGWTLGTDGKWMYTLYIPNGRVKDSPEAQLMTGLYEIAQAHKGDFRLSPNQNLIIGGILGSDKGKIENLLHKYKLSHSQLSGLRLGSMACVALPTCALAMAESERYLPSLITKIEQELENEGLFNDSITIRMTGCPNGCARPSIAEIGLIGKGKIQ